MDKLFFVEPVVGGKLLDKPVVGGLFSQELCNATGGRNAMMNIKC